MYIDEQLTINMQDWLNTKPAKRDLMKGAEMVLKLTRNRILYQNISHNPQKFFGVQYMQLPDYTMGRDYALLNQLRAAVRETEVAATEAFRVGNKYTRKDIIEELNRLSSAIHIMMCMYLAGQYR